MFKVNILSSPFKCSKDFLHLHVVQSPPAHIATACVHYFCLSFTVSPQTRTSPDYRFIWRFYTEVCLELCNF